MAVVQLWQSLHVRIVCNNSLNAALLNNSNAVFIKHTANAEQKLQEAARIISIFQDISTQLEKGDCRKLR
jgi:hypothetical protein